MLWIEGGAYNEKKYRLEAGIHIPGSYPKPDVGVCRNMEEYFSRLSIPER